LIAQENELAEVFLNAQIAAIPFYEKRGYTVISDVFDDAGIPHQTMRKTL
jgi:predicted GNAT family N-acyltransferase